MAGDTDEENRPNGRSDLAEDDSSQVCLYMNKYELLPSLWWPCLFMDWDEISNLYRGPSIDASYQVSVHLAEGFQGED
jgi:hypothetical protein